MLLEDVTARVELLTIDMFESQIVDGYMHWITPQTLSALENMLFQDGGFKGHF